MARNARECKQRWWDKGRSRKYGLDMEVGFEWAWAGLQMKAYRAWASWARRGRRCRLARRSRRAASPGAGRPPHRLPRRSGAAENPSFSGGAVPLSVRVSRPSSTTITTALACDTGLPADIHPKCERNSAKMRSRVPTGRTPATELGKALPCFIFCSRLLLLVSPVLILLIFLYFYFAP